MKVKKGKVALIFLASAALVASLIKDKNEKITDTATVKE